MNILPLHYATVRSNAAVAFAPERSPTPSSTALIGIAIVAVLPALFWTGLVWAASTAFSWNISPVSLATIATTIAIFLSVVCSAVIAAA